MDEETKERFDRRMWEVDDPFTTSPSGGFLKKKYHYRPRAHDDSSVSQYMDKKTESGFIVEDETGALCGFCGKWKEHSKFSARVIENDDSTADTKICRVCDKASQLLIGHANEETQNKAYDMELTLSREEDLGRMYFSKSARDIVRFTKEGYMYTMCKTCYVWKPKSSYFFTKKEFDPKRRHKLRSSCKYCEEFTSRVLRSRENEKTKATINPDYKNITRCFCLYRIYPNDPKRKDILRVYSNKNRAMAKLRKLALRHDPGYIQRGYTSMFMVKPLKIDLKDPNVK